ncbi:MAG: sensor histidine kinase [Gammaproteobacteria bacterium]
MSELLNGSGVRVWQPLRGPFARWPQLGDLLIAVLSFFLTLWMWSQGSGKDVLSMGSLGDVAVYLCAFVGNFALLWRRSHPWQVHAVVLCAALLVLLGPVSDGIFALAFSLYSLGRYESDSRASLIGMSVALAIIVLDLFVFSVPSISGTLAAGLVIALWYFGRRLRFRGEYLRLLEERATHLERERSVESERAVVAERTRIAREMHDIVAHQVSLMTVQAGAAKTVSQSDPKAAGEAMASVEKAGRQALTEMRHLLGVLRPVEEGSTLLPQPGLSDLPALVQEVNDAGPAVQFRTTGLMTGMSARLELCVYRIVQESLTNVIKHAGAGVEVDVSVAVDDESVVVRVRDNGEAGGDTEQTGGHGIVGMCERVDLLRGTLSAGPCNEGGFEIHAVLPLEERSK